MQILVYFALINAFFLVQIPIEGDEDYSDFFSDVEHVNFFSSSSPSELTAT